MLTRLSLRPPATGPKRQTAGWRSGEAFPAFPILILLSLAIAAILFVPPLVGLFAHVSRDYGEGWNAFWALTAVQGHPLYAPAHVLIANNYPPLSFYITGVLGVAIGDQIFAGRVVSLLGMLGVAYLVFVIVRLLSGSRRWAVVSALVLLLYCATYFRQFVAIDNPQWLGEALALSSVMPLLTVPPSALRPRSILLSAALMIVAGLVKHNQVAMPIAVTGWLFIHNRRALLLWVASGTILLAITCLLLYALYGPAIFAEIIGFKRTLDIENFRAGLGKIAGLATLIVVGGVSAFWQRRDQRAQLMIAFAAIGLVIGALQRLGSGVYLNAQFDGLIGLVIVCGLLLGRAAAESLDVSIERWPRSALLLAMLIPVLLVAPKHIGFAIADTTALPGDQASWAAMIDDVRGTPGPAFCEYLAVCYWAGKPMGLDFFAYGQKLRTGTNSADLERQIATRSIARLIVDRDKNYAIGKGRLPLPFPALIEANYRVSLAGPDDIYLMVPRTR